MPKIGPRHKMLKPVRGGVVRSSPTKSMTKNQKYVKAARKNGNKSR